MEHYKIIKEIKWIMVIASMGLYGCQSTSVNQYSSPKAEVQEMNVSQQQNIAHVVSVTDLPAPPVVIDATMQELPVD